MANTLLVDSVYATIFRTVHALVLVRLVVMDGSFLYQFSLFQAMQS